MKYVITDEYPRLAVKYWLLCVGGYEHVTVKHTKKGHTSFENKYGDVMTFHYCVNFEDAKFYNKTTISNINELCGEDEEK